MNMAPRWGTWCRLAVLAAGLTVVGGCRSCGDNQSLPDAKAEIVDGSSDGSDALRDAAGDGRVDATPDAPPDGPMSCATSAQCDDHDPCNGVETCGSNGMCVAGTALVCNDGNACTTDACVVGTGCTTTPIVCDDTNPCTGDTCDPSVGCVATPLTGQSCADANLCDGQEFCNSAGMCVAGIPLTCDDGNLCTIDSCDPATGCVATPNVGASCSDGNLCNGNETCNAIGACTAGTPLSCNDGQSCTNDSCDPSLGCAHTPTPGSSCSDGNPCNGFETCTAGGTCGTPPPLDCNDNIACTVDLCGMQGCVNTPITTPINNDGCCPAGATSLTDNDCSASCGNGAVEPLAGETCDTAIAAGMPGACPTACDDANGCTADALISAGTCQARCSNTGIEGLACPDGDACNGDEFCTASGTCAAGTPLLCSDGNGCTTDTCSPTAGCTFTPSVGASCSDGNLCNGAEVCDAAAACRSGTPITCSDGNACTADVCTPATGVCSFPALDADADGFGPIACGGTDCNDLNAAVHPGATEICDNLDNNCNGTVDENFKNYNDPCTADTECCSGTCTANRCAFGSGDLCLSLNEPCVAPAECCTGRCEASINGVKRCVDAVTCAPAGTACGQAADCCSLYCDPTTFKCSNSSSCDPIAASCLDNVECCGNICAGGSCNTVGPGCATLGEVCSSGGTCCSGVCASGRCSFIDTCRSDGDLCNVNADCCNDSCVNGRCTILGACLTVGNPCSGFGSCCSNACVDTGLGTGQCEYLCGCRPLNEVCDANGDCCSGSCLPDSSGVPRCSKDTPCLEDGEVCGGSGASQNCCSGGKPGCKNTHSGIPRCVGLAACKSAGELCGACDQCCSNICIQDANQVFRCADTCVVVGGTGCSTDADCCDNGTCLDSQCFPATSSCAPLGAACDALKPCCGATCIAGTCQL
jgi:hypothetical protein